MQRRLQSGQELIDIGRAEHQRRADFQGMALGSGGRNQDVVFAQAVDKVCGAGGVGMPLGHDVLPQKQTGGAQGAKAVVGLGKGQQAVAEQGTDPGCVGFEALALNHLKNGHGGGGGDGIAAEGVEIARPVAKCGDHARPQRKAGHRIAVAHRLAHRHHVGDQAVALKAPHRLSRPGKAGLHLVCDEKATGGPDHLGCRFQKAGRVGMDAVGGKDRVDQQGSRLDAVAGQVVDRGLHVAGKGSARRRSGNGADMGAERNPGAEAGGKRCGGQRHAVIGVFGHDHPGAAGMGKGDAQGEVIGL